MKCMQCGHNNPGALLYCQKCGIKLDMTADEIQRFYTDKIKDEKRKSEDFYARRTLTVAIVLFVVAILVLWFAGGAPQGLSYVPSATVNSEFIKDDFKFDSKMDEILIPLEETRK